MFKFFAILIIEIVFFWAIIDLFFICPTRKEKNTLIARGEITIDDKNKRKVKLCTKRLRVQKQIKELREELYSLNIEIENAKVGK